MKIVHVSVKISNHKTFIKFSKNNHYPILIKKNLFQTYLNLILKYPPWKPGKINLTVRALISCTILALHCCFSSRYLNFLPINQKVYGFFCFNSGILENRKSQPFRS